MLPHTGHWAASIARAPTTPSTPTTVRPGAEAARPQPQNFLAPNGTIAPGAPGPAGRASLKESSRTPLGSLPFAVLYYAKGALFASVPPPYAIMISSDTWHSSLFGSLRTK